MIFIDCEFTSLKNPVLLSIGLVTDGGEELYIEISNKKIWGVSSDFVIETVLPQFGRIGHSVSTNAEVGQLIGCWFDQVQSGKQIDIAYDYHADFDLLEQALRDAGLWGRFEKILVPNHVGYMLGHELVVSAMDHSWKMSKLNRGIDRHHALADAIALKCSFESMHSMTKNLPLVR
jgi:hypothetical protein